MADGVRKSQSLGSINIHGVKPKQKHEERVPWLLRQFIVSNFGLIKL